MKALAMIVAFTVGFCSFAPPPSAGSMNQIASPTYTPAAGSPERREMMDALRMKYNKDVIFIVHRLKVSGDWAYAIVNAQTRDTREAYEQQSALLHRENGKWVFKGEVTATGPEDYEEEYRELRAQYPQAPKEIFGEEDLKTPSKPSSPAVSKPSEQSTPVNTQVKGGARDDIHAVDFRNFTYALSDFCGKGFGKKKITARNGAFTASSDWELAVGGVVYGDLTGDGQDEAVVMTSCGGMHPEDEPYVFTLKDGKAFLLTRLESGNGALGGYQKIEIKNGVLITERLQGSAACCPENIERRSYKWDGKTFVEVGRPERRQFKQ